MKIKVPIFLILIIICSLLTLDAQIPSKKNTKNQKLVKEQNDDPQPINTYYGFPPIPIKEKSKFNEKLLKKRDLPSVFSELKTDTMMQIERLAAFYFHQLINEYRIKNGKPWLQWDEELWLASRNHSLYITITFEHIQDSYNKFQTGYWQDSRIDWVRENRERNDYSGENLCGFPFGSKNYYKIEEFAKYIAETALESWKTSPGHNKNMLEDKHGKHATAFVFDNKQCIYATSLFAFSYPDYQYEQISINWNSEMSKRNIPTFVVNNKKVSSSMSEAELKAKAFEIVKKLMPSEKNTLDNGMKIAALYHLKYIKKNDTTTLVQNPKSKNYYATTTQKRYLKASKFKGLFYTMKHQINEKCFIIPIDLVDFIDKTVFEKIEQALVNELPDKALIKKWGFAIDFFQFENKELYFQFKKNYICIIDVVWSEDKK
jgi:hypothetical protein